MILCQKRPQAQLDEQVGIGNYEAFLKIKIWIDVNSLSPPLLACVQTPSPLSLSSPFLFWGETASVHRLRLSLSKIDIVATDAVFSVSVLDSCPQNT